MAEVNTLTIDQLTEQDTAVRLDRFDESTAWQIGAGLHERSVAAGHPITIDIRTPLAVLFRSSLPGSVPDQQDWVRRKSASVFRFGSSSALVAARVDQAFPGADTLPWIDAREFAITGGSFPVRVAGVGIVAAVSVSGLTSEEDHLLAFDAVRRAAS